jgi:hypothetical protein
MSLPTADQARTPTALNGIDFNLSRVVSPPLAGFLVAVFGPPIAFAINATSFLPTVAVMRPRDTGRRATNAALREAFAADFGSNAAFICPGALFVVLGVAT